MGDLGKKGSKGPDRVVAGKSGNIGQSNSEGKFDGDLKPKRPGGTRGSKGGAR